MLPDVKEKAQWDALIESLSAICELLLQKTASVPADHVQIRIIDGMFRKSVDTLRAVQLLYDASLPIQAQALIRILLEARIDVEMFFRACAQDQAEAVRRLLDSMMLQKITQQRESSFKGFDLIAGAPSRDDLLQREQLLVDRYGANEVRKMRRHGFSGLSVGDRANQLGLGDEYAVVYRNFSRNVHNADYMEHLGAQGAVDPDRWRFYEDLRDHVALSTAIACVWRVAWFADRLFGSERSDRLISLWEDCIGFRYWVRDAAENIGVGKFPA